jgi:tetratricopeptide (TPR) repeat protein
MDRLDPDADRAAIRAAIQAGGADRVKTLVKALDGSKVPAWFAVSVGFHPMVPPEDGVRLMAAAWRAHPSNYVLAYRCSHRQWGMQDRIAEMLAWSKVAVALRPDSPFAHNQLGMAWRAMGNLVEAEMSARRAIELGRQHPRYAGARVGLGNVMLEKGDLDSAEANYRAAIAIDPDSPCYYNIGLVYEKRRDLAEAEKWFRKAVAVAPTNTYFSEYADRVVQERAQLARLDAIGARREKPATPAEAIELAIQAAHSTPPRYGLTVRLYSEAFAADPALADPLKTQYRYWAACDAVHAVTSQDKKSSEVGVDERGRLTGLALKWLRADLTQWTLQARDAKQWPQVREKLTGWKKDAGLAAVRDPVWLAEMPPADRKAWESLWRDVDALLASIEQRAGPPPAKP